MSDSHYRVDRKLVLGDWPAFILIAADMLLGAYEFRRLPAQVPIHWGSGGANGFAPAWVAAFVIPLGVLALHVYMLYAPGFSAKMARYAEVPAFYKLMRWAVVLLMSGVFLVSIGTGLHWQF